MSKNIRDDKRSKDAVDNLEMSELEKNVLEKIQKKHDAKLKTRPTVLKAVRKYRKTNRNRNLNHEGYLRIRRQAMTFIKPKKGTRAESYIKEKGNQYYKDLVELNELLKERITELHLNIGEDNKNDK